MAQRFIINSGFHFNSFEAVFKFLRLNFLRTVLGEEELNKFVWNTNLTHVPSLNYVLDEKDTTDIFIPDITKNEILSRMLKKHDRFELDNLLPDELKTLKVEVTEDYFREYKTKLNKQNKYTPPEKRMTISIKPILEDDSWTAYKQMGSSINTAPRTIMENNALRIQMQRKRYRFDCNISFIFRSKMAALEIANIIYDKIDTNKFFFMHNNFYHKINIPNDLISFVKLINHMNFDEVWSYLQDFSGVKITAEKDYATGENLALFMAFNTEPLLNVSSIEYDEVEKRVNMTFTLEVNLPRSINVSTYFPKQKITEELFMQQVLSVQAIKDITETMSEEDSEKTRFEILKFNIGYIRKYQLELGVTDAEIDEMKDGLKFVVINTNGLTKEDIEFVSKYSSFEYEINELDINLDVEPEFVKEIIRTKITDNNKVYKLLKTLYFNNVSKHTKEIRISDDLIQLHLDEHIDSIKLIVEGFDESEYKIVKVEREFIIEFEFEVSGLIECSFYRTNI